MSDFRPCQWAEESEDDEEEETPTTSAPAVEESEFLYGLRRGAGCAIYQKLKLTPLGR